ncbi:MAG TPA: hypothetical protein VNN07_10590 [Candidatus Tectomicrobia bacterium]|nr:hypothetical protein [Candidatus Tectomicrobia bacterium]
MSGVLAVVAALALVSCAGARVADGVFRSERGYRVSLPGPGWRVVEDSRADLELRHADGAAGMLVNAACDPAMLRRSHEILLRHLLLGVRDREVIEAGELPLNGRVAGHALLEGRWRQDDERMRIEAYVLKGRTCVYDLVYAAPPAVFGARHEDFRRFVDSFTTE